MEDATGILLNFVEMILSVWWFVRRWRLCGC